MSVTLISAGFGCLGGLTRSTVGILKAKARKEQIKIGFIIRTLRFSALSGTILGAVFSFNPAISFIAGYAGSDIIEGIHASLKRTKFGKRHFDI